MNFWFQSQNDIDDFMCAICFRNYSALLTPRNLSCGHCFCEECIEKLVQDDKICCPFDRSITQNFGTVKDLNQNLSLMSVIDRYNQDKRQFLEAQNNLKQAVIDIRKTITHLYEKNYKDFLVYLDNCNKHIYSCTTTLTDAGILERAATNSRKLSENQLKKLREYIAQTKKDYEYFTEKLRYLENAKDKMEVLNNQAKNEDSLEKLIDMKLALLRIKIPDEDINKIKSPIAGHSYLINFESENSQLLQNLNENSKINEILNAINNELDNNFYLRYKIGLIGDSGVGKSSFINRIRNLNDTDTQNGAAQTGIQETTTNMYKYKWNENPNIEFIDFPGYGTYDAIEDYSKEWLSRNHCDIYILIHHRLKKNDILLIKYIHDNLKRPFVVAKSYTDNSIEFLIASEKEAGREMSEEEALKKIKDANIINLDKYNNLFNEKFKKEDLEPFNISCKKDKMMKYEMEELIETITKRCPTELGDNFSEFCFSAGKKQIIAKRQVLEKRINKLAFASAATDIIPFAGTVVDIAILVVEVTHYRDCFGLTEENLIEVGRMFNVPTEKSKEIAKVLGFDAKYVNLKNFILTTLSGLSIGLGAAITKSIFGAVGLGVGLVTFGVGCLVTGAISAPISYVLTKKVLKKILYQMEYDSLRMIDLMKNNNLNINGDNLNENENVEWIPDESCNICMVCNQTEFSLLHRKHHCRKCGFVVCDKCSTQRCMIPSLGKDPQRVCDDCYQITESLKEWNASDL